MGQNDSEVGPAISPVHCKRQPAGGGHPKYEHYNKYRFKQIIVVSSNGNIHRHKHNDDST